MCQCREKVGLDWPTYDSLYRPCVHALELCDANRKFGLRCQSEMYEIDDLFMWFPVWLSSMMLIIMCTCVLERSYVGCQTWEKWNVGLWSLTKSLRLVSCFVVMGDEEGPHILGHLSEERLRRALQWWRNNCVSCRQPQQIAGEPEAKWSREFEWIIQRQWASCCQNVKLECLFFCRWKIKCR